MARIFLNSSVAFLSIFPPSILCEPTLMTRTPFAIPDEISAASRLGSKLLSNSRFLENSNNQKNTTWIKGYSLKFVKCHSIVQYRVEEEGDEKQGHNPTEVQHLVNFRLCPSNTCGSFCFGGGDYVVAMREFVNAYIGLRHKARENDCVVAQEKCNCNTSSDKEVCEARCYVNAGVEYCIDEGTEISQYMRCREMGTSEEGDVSYKAFIGPYCSNNGQSIHLGVFRDEKCINLAPPGSYEEQNIRQQLPFKETSIIGPECILCRQTSQQSKNNDYYNMSGDVVGLCEKLYEPSAKCEKSLKVQHHSASTDACDYIQKVLPRVTMSLRHGVSAPVVFAWMLAFFAFAMTGYACFTHNQLKYERGRRFDALNALHASRANAKIREKKVRFAIQSKEDSVEVAIA